MVKSLIFCEGNQDVKFLSLFCKDFLELDMKTISIKQLGNKSNFFKEELYTQTKQQVQTGMIDKILFVLDSDFEENDAHKGGYKNTVNTIKEMIKKLDFEEVSDYYISCDPTTKNGNLEHLILSTMDTTKKECVEKFIECVDGKEAHKNKKIVLTGYQSIFREAPYNFNHKHFGELKNKIMKLGK